MSIKTVKRKILPVMMILALCIGMIGCGSSKQITDREDGSLRKVIAARRIVIGLDDAYPPMGFRDAKGELVGFDIDMAKEFCKRVGIEPVFKPIVWEDKERSLNSGEIDCIWNGMSVTPERAEAMNLSESYVKNELIFVVSGDSDVKASRDLKGKRLGVQGGSSTEDAIRKDSLHRDVHVSVYNSIPTLLGELKSGRVDAVLIDSIVAYFCIFNSGETYYVLPDSLAEEECAIGFRKGDKALRDKVQSVISEMKADGTLAKISEKWFGTDITIVK
ncbi:MAG: amino acid ABC transporter substrate-binding protein [Lachnospiraceae bacterium]|nr:amino acid ABC transporter substrate-binding protein [Lachnospiraceae bacterium]